MDAIICLETRRSIRKFTDEKVSDETIRELVRLASLAPSWHRVYGIRFVAVKDEKLKKHIAEDCVCGFKLNTHNINVAPCLIVITSINGKIGYFPETGGWTKKGDSWSLFDAGCAAENLCLAAHAKGLATVIMGMFDQDKIAEAIDLPNNQRVETIIALGYPGKEANCPARPELDELYTIK